MNNHSPHQPRVQKGVPTGGQFATAAHGESGVSLGGDTAQPARPQVAQTTATPQPAARPSRAQKIWGALNRVMSFGTDKGAPTSRADRADLASRSAAAAGTAAMAGGVAVGAPVIAAGAGIVLAVGAVGVLAATAAQARGRARAA